MLSDPERRHSGRKNLHCSIRIVAGKTKHLFERCISAIHITRRTCTWCRLTSHASQLCGAIDVFYKIKPFMTRATGVHLHCFQYGRDPSPVLDSPLCQCAILQKGHQPKPISSQATYIVATRSSEELMKKPRKGKVSHLLEGIHTCHYLEDPRLRKRKRIVQNP